MGKLINQILTEQLISSSSLAYRNFSQTCRSTSTRTLYTKALHYFMNYIQLTHDQYDKLLEKDPKMIQMDICDFVMFLKQNNLSYAAISSYVAAIKKFYDMNDITTLNWRKVKHFMGEHEKIAEDRPYTHSEIHTLLEATTYRNRGI